MESMVPYGISAAKLVQTPSSWVSIVRRSLIRDFERKGVRPTRDDAWSWSMWRGYLKNDDGSAVYDWFKTGGSHVAHIHTSGHASPTDLQSFAKAMKAQWVVPIHGIAWDKAGKDFVNLHRLNDGEPMTL